MADIFTYDPDILGSKGLIFIGDKLLVYRRDTNTSFFPLYLDFPGGGAETDETPFETFARELWEEFRLTIQPEDVYYWTRYPAGQQVGKYGYMLAARFPAETTNDIVFGDEGINWQLMTVDEFLQREDSWPVLKEQTTAYLAAMTA